MGIITVIGSLNMDLVVRTARTPHAGETLAGSDFHLIPGGKGANQAVAVSRSGAITQMIGCVGYDAFGPALLNSLNQAGVNSTGVETIKNMSSGTATIIVEEGGENRIIIVPGANAYVTKKMIDEKWGIIKQSDIIVLQLEIPLETVFYIIARASSEGICTILNPAPVYPIPIELLSLIDVMILNETEAEVLSGQVIRNLEDAFTAAKHLYHSGVKTAIITLGEAGAVLVNPQYKLHQPAFEVEVVDSTAAGDTFVGSLAAALLEGKKEPEALLFATAASGLAVTKIGAQPSIPLQEEVNSFIKMKPQTKVIIGGE